MSHQFYQNQYETVHLQNFIPWLFTPINDKLMYRYSVFFFIAIAFV